MTLADPILRDTIPDFAHVLPLPLISRSIDARLTTDWLLIFVSLVLRRNIRVNETTEKCVRDGPSDDWSCLQRASSMTTIVWPTTTSRVRHAYVRAPITRKRVNDRGVRRAHHASLPLLACLRSWNTERLVHERESRIDVMLSNSRACLLINLTWSLSKYLIKYFFPLLLSGLFPLNISDVAGSQLNYNSQIQKLE